MRKWEYKEVEVDTMRVGETQVLNYQGEAGWEAWARTEVQMHQQPYVKLFLKREIVREGSGKTPRAKAKPRKFRLLETMGASPPANEGEKSKGWSHITDP